MCKTYKGELDKIRKEIRQINDVKFMSGLSYSKCMELNKRLSYLIGKYNFINTVSSMLSR